MSTECGKICDDVITINFNVSGLQSVGTFRSEYAYEIEYEYDFADLVCMLQVITGDIKPFCSIPRSAGKQQGRVKAQER